MPGSHIEINNCGAFSICIGIGIVGVNGLVNWDTSDLNSEQKNTNY